MRVFTGECRTLERTTRLQQTLAAIRGCSDLGKLPTEFRKLFDNLDPHKSTDRLVAMRRAMDGDLEANGSKVLRTESNEFFVLWRPTGILYRIDEKDPSFRWWFADYIANIPSDRAADAPYHPLLDSLCVRASKEPVTEIHNIAYYDEVTGTLAVSNGCGAYWSRERGGQWVRHVNGDGLLFFAEREFQPWEPALPEGGVQESFDPDRAGNALDAMLYSMNLEQKRDLTVADQRLLLKVWITALLFPSLMRTRPIPCFLGEAGSGKTTASRMIGRLVQGMKWDVTSVSDRTEGDFPSQVMSKLIMCVDNQDDPCKWFAKAVNEIATGVELSRRKLYADITCLTYIPRAALIINAETPHFRETSTTQRLLQIHFAKRYDFEPESKFWEAFMGWRNEIWGILLTYGAQVADLLAEVSLPMSRFRMADFGSLGSLIVQVMGHTAEEWEMVLSHLTGVQFDFVGSDNVIIDSFGGVLDDNGGILPQRASTQAGSGVESGT